MNHILSFSNIQGIIHENKHDYYNVFFREIHRQRLPKYDTTDTDATTK